MGKKKYEPDYNACIGKHDPFGMIYLGMTTHESFINLTPREKLMYVYCRQQINDPKAKQCLFKHGQDYSREYNPKTDFVFPASHFEKYGIDRGNGSRWLHSLAKKGFIKIKEDNHEQKLVNVYSFIGEWKNSS